MLTNLQQLTNVNNINFSAEMDKFTFFSWELQNNNDDIIQQIHAHMQNDNPIDLKRKGLD